MTPKERKDTYDRTAGRCHICGAKLALDDFHVDHVWALELGGPDVLNNWLPACGPCNHLKWNHHPDSVQRILFLGMLANGHAHKKFTGFGKNVREERAKRLAENWRRRQSRGRILDKAERKQLLQRRDDLCEQFMAFEERAVALCKQKRTKNKDAEHGKGDKLRWRDAVRVLLARTTPKDEPLRSAYQKLMKEQIEAEGPAE
ncbi:MAG TPA: HNH endonuclease signature motif containing protein [Candidatus Micrarchaeaceae archaeon]|nr:HNH endonuclease signature motif containing protein [Candidatus Micrarchaeaceae archaeon]